jgi:folate-binding protein YgfZ
LEAGWPWYGVDITEDNLPQEVNRNEQAISFTKGCYLGQETVARIDALGHVNRRLAGLRFDADDLPRPGLELRIDGKGVGTVTSAAWSPRWDRPIALALLRQKPSAVGTRLASDVGEAEVIDWQTR